MKAKECFSLPGIEFTCLIHDILFAGVTEAELKSIKENASVYVRQTNSSILFKSTKISALNSTRKEIDDLKKEKKKLEAH